MIIAITTRILMIITVVWGVGGVGGGGFGLVLGLRVSGLGITERPRRRLAEGTEAAI